MTLVRWNPVRDMSALQNRINRMFDDSFFAPFKFDDELPVSNWRPAVDIYDKGDHVVIKAELPGLEKKDIHVDLKDRVLTLRGERSIENEVKEDNFYRKERTYGSFQRVFSLPANLDPEKVKADYTDGVLTIEIAKPEKEKPKEITVH